MDRRAGSFTVTGTPITDEIDDINYTQVRYDISKDLRVGTFSDVVREGETWSVTLAGQLFPVHGRQ